MKKNQPILIFGGMGPQAGALLLNRIFTFAADRFGAKAVPDFPDMIINSLPVPEFFDNKNNKKQAAIFIDKRLGQLSALRPVCFSIACNTAHSLVDNFNNKTKIPFVSIIDEVVKKISQERVRSVGILASPESIRTQLYSNKFKKAGIKTIEPDKSQLKIIADLIRKVISNRQTNIDSDKLKKIALSLNNRGAETILLGCTDLPLIFPKKFESRVFDSVDILAMALLQRYYQKY